MLSKVGSRCHPGNIYCGRSQQITLWCCQASRCWGAPVFSPKSDWKNAESSLSDGGRGDGVEFGLFGPRALGRAVHAAAEGQSLSKAEFMGKVRQSNEACQMGDFQTAVKLYGEALRADPQNCILYSNRSAAHLKLGQYQTALDDAVKARLLNPKWPKRRDLFVGKEKRAEIWVSFSRTKTCEIIFCVRHQDAASERPEREEVLRDRADGLSLYRRDDSQPSREVAANDECAESADECCFISILQTLSTAPLKDAGEMFSVLCVFMSLLSVCVLKMQGSLVIGCVVSSYVIVQRSGGKRHGDDTLRQVMAIFLLWRHSGVTAELDFN
ncbi:Tetratricopeptide repeat protein 28 [Triplophysa tibetana]|uniref:Tetratricopeptide repeat protein 28 n=1 Tax=Triplophysa tibetana TaxID=1572043 RepID=A0A5A9N2I9_9TELE|nr:Tetratricopeptide repeat protein 28 [Triplophysa tibetana]